MCPSYSTTTRTLGAHCLAPVCKKLFKTESARLIEQYNIDVEASMGPKFDYVFFHHDPDLTPKKLAQMCPDKN